MRKSEQKVVSVLVVLLDIDYRIGEATNPGPDLLTLNAGGWDKAKRFLCRNLAEWQVEGLTDRPDVIFLQETWLTQSQIPRAKREAHEIGFHALFVPALKPNHKGRASGGLAVLANQFLPGVKPAKGTHWAKHRWMRTLLPSEPPVHLINVYGYDSSIPNSHALNRALFAET